MVCEGDGVVDIPRGNLRLGVFSVAGQLVYSKGRWAAAVRVRVSDQTLLPRM